MPELAEVEYYRKQWSPGVGETVAAVRLHAEKRIFRGVDTDALAKRLPGQELKDSQTHGKQMCFVFGDQHWLGVHLGMTGKTSVPGADARPAKHDHLVIEMRSGLKLVFSDPRLFGRIHYGHSKSPPDWWSGLPLEGRGTLSQDRLSAGSREARRPDHLLVAGLAGVRILLGFSIAMPFESPSPYFHGFNRRSD